MLLYWNGHIFINFNLQKSGTPTLQDLFFTARPGELLAVVGPVGAGKVSCDAFCQLDATPLSLLNSPSWAQSYAWHSLNWVYLEQCFSICVPWNISFARRFHGQINLDKHTLCFLCGASNCTVGNHCQEFGHLSEWNYWCDSCSGWMETVGTSFHHSGPSRKSGDGEGSSRKLWAFPHGTWCDLSVHV